MKRLLRLLPILILFAPVLVPAADKLSTGRVLSARLLKVRPNANIRGLRIFEPARLLIEEREAPDGGYEYFVKLSGDFTADEDSVLVLNRQDEVARITPGKLTQPFSFRVPVLSERTPIQLEALTSKGRTEALALVIVASFEQSNLAGDRKGWQPSVSLGPSVIRHQETAAPSFDAAVLTFKAAFEKRLAGPWALGGMLFVTALPMNASIEGLSPVFLGSSLRVGYATRWLPVPWSLSWNLGFYYISLFGVGEAYAFANLYGVQPFPYPVLSRRVSSTSVLSLVPRYSPIWADFPRNLMDHVQLSVSLRYTRLLGRSRSWFVSADYSQFESSFDPVDVKSNSMSLAGGVGF